MKPKLSQRLRLAVNTLRGTTKNNASLRNARAFLKYGNGKTTVPNWSQVLMSDEDSYTGIMQGAINIRGVTVTALATNNLITEASQPLMDQARKKRETITHPYLEIIDQSPTFSNYQFWYTNSIYLDLEGLAYVLVIRNVGEKLVGNVQEFKLLNPFNVQRIFDQQSGKLIGYKEYRGGMVRELPVEMIIPIVNLNPFNQEPFSMADAAKDHQFTLKTASDYTRSAIANNINAPGIIATDRELEGEELANFKERVMSHQKGEPIFGGGAGSITWNDMQADLNKAALTDVNTISLQNIIAVSGASKTMLGWEESGTTRDTALVQKDNFVELRAMPQLQTIVDALNQDYKNYYSADYKVNQYKIRIENPLATDLDEEKKMVDNRQLNFDLYNALVNKGYDRDIAARYAEGDMGLEELGEPANEPILPPEAKPQDVPKDTPPKDTSNELHGEHLQQIESGLLASVQSSLQNTIVNIDNRLLAAVSAYVSEVKNKFAEEDDVIPEKQRKILQNELELALATFYGIILPLYANNTLSKRLEQYGKSAQFKLNNEVKAFIRDVAGKASESHISTLLNAMIEQAQKDALAGLGRDQIARNLLNKFGGEIANTRAVLIARTEAQRAFNMSQYQADKQFIKQAGFETQAYKRLVSTTGSPCPFCAALIAEPPIPFDEPFAEVGDELEATIEVDGKTKVKKMTMGFLDADAGNIHPNCACVYELIIE